MREFAPPPPPSAEVVVPPLGEIELDSPLPLEETDATDAVGVGTPPVPTVT